MRLFRAAPFLLALGLVLAACSGSGSAGEPTTAPTQAPATSAPASVEPSPEAPESPAESPADAGSVTVDVASSGLGDILVDGEGLTLYAFTPDTDGESTCYDDCADAWPPLLSDAAPAAGTGLDAAGFSLVDRTDGGKQVVYNNWPLYYFAADAAPGDTNGQGVGGKWYVLAPDGSLIK